MKKVFFTFFALLSLFIATGAKAEFSTSAASAFLIDYDSGMEIVAKNPDVLMPPSSMLKLMTLAVLFDEIKAGHLKLDDKLPVSENADYNNPLWQQASKICLVRGQKISVRDAIMGLIVLSGGDAAVVVAEKLAGSEPVFTELMSKKADKIGLKLSTFGNASGLPDPNNLMTSRELAMLANYIISNYPKFYPLFATKRFEFNDYKNDWCQEWGKTHTLNYNKLLFIMPGADGLKTGHTTKGGYGMVASSRVGGRRLIGVINGFHGRDHNALAAEMKRLLDYGYSKTKNKIFYRPGDEIAKIPVWYGRQNYVVATVAKPFAITLAKSGDLSGITILARYNEPQPATIKKGATVGEIVAEKNGNVIARAPLIAAQTVKKVQFFGRIVENLKYIFGLI